MRAWEGMCGMIGIAEGGGWAYGGVGVLVNKSLESSLISVRDGLVWVELMEEEN